MQKYSQNGNIWEILCYTAKIPKLGISEKHLFMKQQTKIFLVVAFAAAVLVCAGAGAQTGGELAGFLDGWAANIKILREERLGKSFAFAPPAEPDKNSLYWKARTEENPAAIAAAVSQFPEQLDAPARFPDIEPLQEATPMHIAAVFNPNPEVLQSLADGGGDVNATENDNGATPLHAALYANRPLPIIRKLAELGADVNAKLTGGKYGGMAPLHLAAAKSDNPEVVAYLVQNGADTSETFDYGIFTVTPIKALNYNEHKNMRKNPEILALLETN
ncbi:MAG: hypothetical protein HAW59_03195 [Betaproteobacteria bacterium]|nr:hypothetical protein [Betaproteobacteria bacterium]